MSYTLVIGNRSYSSWSLRPWIAMKVAAIPFDEILVQIGSDQTRESILPHSPAGKVPILKHGQLIVWDSLAILEYLHERHPEAGLWPADQEARAHARSISAEMHSGFLALRRHYTMNVRRTTSDWPRPSEAEADIARVQEIWRNARARFGKNGSFLFGDFSAADAMYAPVVTRFQTYEIPVGAEIRAYMDAVLNLPAMKEWYADAQKEPWVIEKYEVAPA